MNTKLLTGFYTHAGSLQRLNLKHSVVPPHHSLSLANQCGKQQVQKDQGLFLKSEQNQEIRGQCLNRIRGQRNTHSPSRRLVLFLPQQMLPVEQLPAPSCCAVELQRACGAVCWSRGLSFLASSCPMAWRIGRKNTLSPTCLCISHKPEHHPSLLCASSHSLGKAGMWSKLKRKRQPSHLARLHTKKAMD